jgi:pimeloyl-ACP methyl ester carboxylesterase
MTSIENTLHLTSLSPAVALPKRTPLPWKIARIACGALGALAIVVAAGAAYEQIASAGDAAAYPAPGRMVDVGGYKLHLDCRGEGSPTIVMDAGLGASSLDWSLVQPELARSTQVCTYDRAGMGWSEAGPQPRSPAHLADELHALLHNAGVPGPYVLVGHSLAGKNIRMFASAHPDEVAGMVLVDARSEIVDATADMQAFAAALEGQAAQYSVARRFGIARLFGGGLIDLPLVSPALATQMALFQTNPAAIAETTDEGLNRTADDKSLASANLGAMPLVVIAAGDSMRNMPGWSEAQTAMAGLSTHGQLIVAERSSHAVHLVEPKLVIDAALSVLADVNKTAPR